MQEEEKKLAFKLKNTKDAKEALHRLQALVDQSSLNKDYRNFGEISHLANKLFEMKLRDDFLVDDLDASEQKTLSLAIIIART